MYCTCSYNIHLILVHDGTCSENKYSRIMVQGALLYCIKNIILHSSSFSETSRCRTTRSERRWRCGAFLQRRCSCLWICEASNRRLESCCSTNTLLPLIKMRSENKDRWGSRYARLLFLSSTFRCNVNRNIFMSRYRTRRSCGLNRFCLEEASRLSFSTWITWARLPSKYDLIHSDPSWLICTF